MQNNPNNMNQPFQQGNLNHAAGGNQALFGKEGAIQVYEEPKNIDVEVWIWPKEQDVTVENT